MKQERLRLVKKWCDPWSTCKLLCQLTISEVAQETSCDWQYSQTCHAIYAMPNQFQAGSAIQVTLSLPRRAPPASSLGEVQSGAWCGTWYPLCICLSFCDFCLLNVEPIGLVSSSVSQNHRIIVYPFSTTKRPILSVLPELSPNSGIGPRSNREAPGTWK
jgi:hypothetical protein